MRILITIFFLVFSTSGFSEENKVPNLSHFENEEPSYSFKEQVAYRILSSINAQEDKEIPEQSIEALKDSRINRSQKSLPKKRSQSRLGGYINVAGYAQSINIEGYNFNFVGTNFSAGINIKKEKHQLGIGLSLLNTRAESVEASGTTYSLTGQGLETSFSGIGPAFGYSYRINDSSTIGIFTSVSQGSTDICAIGYNECVNENYTILDAGIKFSLKVGYWEPFLKLGSSSQYNEDVMYRGVSAQVGLLSLSF